MTKMCPICNKPFQHNDAVIMGIRTVYISLPSAKTWAVEKPSPNDCVFLHHEECERLI